MQIGEGGTFDWTVPARFGAHADRDGLTDYARTPDEINPSSWPVNFDACQLPPGKKFTWHVDKRPVAARASGEGAIRARLRHDEGRCEGLLPV